MNNETIKFACVKYNDNLYTEFNHGECFKKLPQDANMRNTMQGFITNTGRFVDRRTAFEIAKQANQIECISKDNNVLISEDLYLYWLKEQSKELGKNTNETLHYEKKYEDKIAELENKLAESEISKEKFKIMYFNQCTDCERLQEQLNDSEQKCLICSKDQENEQLKNQLDAKEKDIQLLKSICTDKQNHIDALQNVCNQDKISFCIEQLEKMKYLYKKHLDHEKIYDCFRVQLLEEEIYNQIKQLKEM